MTSKNSNIPKEPPTFIDPDINLERIKKECEKLIKYRATASAGVAIIPIPFLDVAIDAGLLSLLLPEITARFGLIEHPDDLGKLGSKDERLTDVKNSIFHFAGLVTMRSVAKQAFQGFGGRIIAKQFGKFIPFGGQIFAASVGYVVFSKVANQHVNECYKLAQRIQSKTIVGETIVS